MTEAGLFGPLFPLSGEYTVFQDESGVRGSDRWLILGFLFVPTSMLGSLVAILDRTKTACGCQHEIHFTALPKKYGEGYGSRGKAAARWMREYKATWHKSAGFTALAIDVRRLDSKAFPTRFYVQNRLCVTGIKTGIAWHIGPEKLEELELKIVYDRHDLPDKSKTGYDDNYATYVGPRLEAEVSAARLSGKKGYPNLKVGTVSAEDSADSLPLQLTDLLLGAVSQAVTHGSAQVVKSALGLAATHWCMDVSQSPWLQQLGMHRRLNLLAFPDEKGEMYDLANVVQEASGDSDLFQS